MIDVGMELGIDRTDASPTRGIGATGQASKPARSRSIKIVRSLDDQGS